MPKKDIEMGKKMLAAGETMGPGGCRGVAECGAYCDDISHIKECVAFAEKNNLMPPEELAEAKKVAAALDRGVQLPPCSSKSECDGVCAKPENMKTCIAFAKEAGLMPPEELEEAEKVLAAIEKGAVPPPCASKNACDEYCGLPENFETCISFAEAAGFVSPEEATMARRTGGKGPGNCRGKDECEAFCEDPANAEKCINFAEEFGFMSPEEAEMARKMMAAGMGLGGPGGCKGQEECETYCEDPAHLEECVDFAEKAGFMSSEDADRARRMAESGINMMEGGPGGCKGEEECQAFCEDPTNMEECLEFAVQIGDMTPEEAQEILEMIEGGMPSEEMMEQEEMMPEEMMGPPEEQIQEEIQRQIEQQIQQEIEEQMREQIEQMMPPQEELPPQSLPLLDQVKRFLAGVATVFGF